MSTKYSQNVLVIEDDKTTGSLAVSSLESIGLKAETATDIRQAVQMIEARQNKPDRYHIILLDWDIQGQDGIQAARELFGQFGTDLPIIILSDGEWNEFDTESEEAGICGFISKPLFRSSLYYSLRQFTDTAEQSPDQAQEEESIADLSGRRILVAEDNELNWEIASELLREFGLEPDWAENGKICVEKFEQSAPGWYDAILMDLRMPVMTGFEAASAIRRSVQNGALTIPIIAVSADAFEEDVQKCLDHGMNAHMEKPVDPQKLLSLLEQYLQQNF